jgi:hypothetical protein
VAKSDVPDVVVKETDNHQPFVAKLLDGEYVYMAQHYRDIVIEPRVARLLRDWLIEAFPPLL